VLWNDPEIGIQWPMEKGLSISDKDRLSPLLSSIPEQKLPMYS